MLLHIGGEPITHTHLPWPGPPPVRVVAFEPVRKFRAYLEWALHANGVAWLVDVVPHVGSHGGGRGAPGVDSGSTGPTTQPHSHAG